MVNAGSESTCELVATLGRLYPGNIAGKGRRALCESSPGLLMLRIGMVASGSTSYSAATSATTPVVGTDRSKRQHGGGTLIAVNVRFTGDNIMGGSKISTRAVCAIQVECATWLPRVPMRLEEALVA